MKCNEGLCSPKIVGCLIFPSVRAKNHSLTLKQWITGFKVSSKLAPVTGQVGCMQRQDP